MTKASETQGTQKVVYSIVNGDVRQEITQGKLIRSSSWELLKIDERHPSVRKSYTGDPHQTVESKAQDRTVRHSRKKKTHNTAGNKDKDDE